MAEASGHEVDRATVAASLVRGLRELTSAASARLSPELHQEILDRNALQGRPILTEACGVGIGAGITAKGALLLDRPDGSRLRVVAGSVRPASVGRRGQGHHTAWVVPEVS